ncbi:MAG: hypothetical protein RL139_314 [Gemmatimonadota bacterium]
MLAMLLDLPIAPARPVAPWVALDVSASWRAADPRAWATARALVDSLRGAGADSVVFFGDSLRGGDAPTEPVDGRTGVAPVVEAALALGQPVVVITDGAIEDPEQLGRLPRGSRVRVIAQPAGPDAALAALEAPGGAVGGDTIEVRLVARGGAVGAPARRLIVRLGDRTVAEVAVGALDAYEEREARLRVGVPARDGTLRLVARLEGDAADAVPANDSAVTTLIVSGAAAATFVSSAPDQDARFLLAVLRGTRRGPVQGFWRVAPGQWRTDGALRPVPENAVREAVAAAPLVVLHGDTALFGPPRQRTRGALVLVAPPPAGEDFYPAGTGDSPLAAVLAGIPWDSLPPLDVAAMPERGTAAVLARRGRRFDERAVVRLEESPRRVATVPAAGFGRWRLRGGRSADAFDALWGSVFDWAGADSAATGEAMRPPAVSTELVPQRPTVADGTVGTGAVVGRVPRALSAWWLAALAIAALCAEWILRRRRGLR